MVVKLPATYLKCQNRRRDIVDVFSLLFYHFTVLKRSTSLLAILDGAVR